MGRVNQLWQDQFEARTEAYMEANPDADPSEAYEAAMDAMGVRE